jgi:hypothetical protein
MPEQVDPPPANQSFPGKSHYFPDFFPMPRPIAVDMAMLAGRLRVQGAHQASFESIKKEFPTLGTEPNLLKSPAWKIGFPQLYPFLIVKGPTIKF